MQLEKDAEGRVRVTRLTFRTGANRTSSTPGHGGTRPLRLLAGLNAPLREPRIDRSWTDRRVLDQGRMDFDAVIFAMGIEDFLEFARAEGRQGSGQERVLRDMPAEWDEMGREVQTVATQAAQVWLDKDLEELGWHRGSGLISALELPFDTWADMTHTLASEQAWRKATGCGVGRRLPRNRSRTSAACCRSMKIDQRRVLLRAQAAKMLET